MPSLPRTLSMQTPCMPLSALMLTVSPRRLGDPFGERAREPRQLDPLELQAGDLEQPERQLPFAVRRALDDALLVEIEQQAVHRAERQLQLLGHGAHAQRPLAGQQLHHLDRSR